jgi:hypothetical protein
MRGSCNLFHTRAHHLVHPIPLWRATLLQPVALSRSRVVGRLDEERRVKPCQAAPRRVGFLCARSASGTSIAPTGLVGALHRGVHTVRRWLVHNERIRLRQVLIRAVPLPF